MSGILESVYIIILFIIFVLAILYGMIGKNKNQQIAVQPGQIPGRYNDYKTLDQINGGLLEIVTDDPRSKLSLYNFEIKGDKNKPYINQIPLGGTGIDKLTPFPVPDNKCYYSDQIIAKKVISVCSGTSGCYPNYAYGELVYNYVTDPDVGPCNTGNDNFGFINIATNNLSVSDVPSGFPGVIVQPPDALNPNQYWKVTRWNADGSSGSNGPILTVKSRKYDKYLIANGNTLGLGDTGEKLWGIMPQYSYTVISSEIISTNHILSTALSDMIHGHFSTSDFYNTHRKNIVSPQQIIYLGNKFDYNKIKDYFPKSDGCDNSSDDPKKDCINLPPKVPPELRFLQSDGTLGEYSMSTDLNYNTADFTDFLLYITKLKSEVLFKDKKNGRNTKKNPKILGTNILGLERIYSNKQYDKKR